MLETQREQVGRINNVLSITKAEFVTVKAHYLEMEGMQKGASCRGDLSRLQRERTNALEGKILPQKATIYKLYYII